ncbi:hypothetical protein NUW54_g9463 [Trametes sanguinea]|uniref:Uncharacterized protein n=1 Tax=Trametes sanguinea TaxID=158606 RepID=A0ACC1P5T5_9APHY|nr:hypothetical protein NUW54_g9463 [Trametes sanguinea]
MPLDPPRPLVPLLPPEHVPPEVHLELARALDPDRRVYVVRRAGQVHARERVREAHAVVREEDRAERERVPEPDRVPGGEARERGGVVPPAVGVLEELTEVVEGRHADPGGWVEMKINPRSSVERKRRLRHTDGDEAVHTQDLDLVVHAKLSMDVVQPRKNGKIAQDSHVLAHLVGDDPHNSQITLTIATDVMYRSTETRRGWELEAPSPASQSVDALDDVGREKLGWLDRVTPFVLYRWLGTAGLLALFALRIVFAQGWYIVAYAHAIYLLNLLLAFLQPKFDPSVQDDILADDMEEGGEGAASPLPSQRDDEFRPFVRRLPEWQFWLSATRATLIATVCTFFEMFDVPVYWPILVVYWFVLFLLTMRRQIQHMIKYKYVPFDFGRKARYGSSR